MRMGLAVAVASLAPGCVGLNPAFDEGREAGDGGGAGTSMSTGGTDPTGTTLLTASASGVTGSATLPMTTTGPGPDVAGSGPSSDSDVMPADWWDAAYRHRVQLVFGRRDEPLSGFVTYVPLGLSPSRLEGVTASQLAFVDADSDTRIPAEIVLLNPEQGDLIAWVQIPTWKSTEATSVFLYFGAGAPQVPSATPWTGHVAVWHMDEFAGLSTPDATGSADATSVGLAGKSIVVVDGVAGGALALDGEGHRLQANLSPSPADDTFLVSVWVNAQGYTNLSSPVIARGDSPGESWLDAEWVLGISAERAEARLHDDDVEASPPPNAGSSPPPTLDQWHHYAFLYTGTWIRFFIDGIERVIAETAAGTQHVLDVVSIGGFSAIEAPGWQDRLLDGRIDELRWRQGADDDGPTNDAWILTLYESQMNPTTTFGAGPVEDL